MIKVTEYNHNESSQCIDVCVRITPPQGEAKDQCIPIYYDEFKEWCFLHGCIYQAFNVRHWSDTDVSYKLNDECEILIEGFLHDLLGMDKTEDYIKGLLHTPILDRTERINVEFDSLLLNVQLLASLVNEQWPKIDSDDPFMSIPQEAGAFKALSRHMKNQLNKMVEKYTPKNKVKVS